MIKLSNLNLLIIFVLCVLGSYGESARVARDRVDLYKRERILCHKAINCVTDDLNVSVRFEW